MNQKRYLSQKFTLKIQKIVVGRFKINSKCLKTLTRDMRREHSDPVKRAFLHSFVHPLVVLIQVNKPWRDLLRLVEQEGRQTNRQRLDVLSSHGLNDVLRAFGHVRGWFQGVSGAEGYHHAVHAVDGIRYGVWLQHIANEELYFVLQLSWHLCFVTDESADMVACGSKVI